jgi:uncharacterized protein YggE
VHGPRYGVRDPSTTIDALLGEAFRDARRKALRLSDAAERRLGAATAVEEVHGGHFDAVFFDGSATVASGSAGDLGLQPARLELAVTVRVSFALAPA